MRARSTAAPAWRRILSFVVDGVRRVVGKARRRRDLAAAHLLGQARRDDLVIEAPADLLGARRGGIRPPGVLVARIGPGAAEAVEPAFLRRRRVVAAAVGDLA